MRLFIDQGNSRLKWVLKRRDGVVVLRGLELTDQLEALRSTLEAQVEDLSSLTVYISSVLAGKKGESVRRCYQHIFPSAVFMRVKSGVCGVDPAYSDLSKLGVDRWLAFIAAHKQCLTDCVVVDAGSAITADFVRGEGEHIGGMILPGVSLMGEALAAKSDALSVSQLNAAQNWKPGCDTVTCIEAGIGACIKGVVREVEDYARSALKEPKVFVTGGDSEILVPWFELEVVVNQGLVLDGMELVADQL